MDSDAVLEKLPKALVSLREGEGLTAAAAVDIARSKGRRLTAPRLSKWETGGQVPAVESLVRYLACLGKNLCDLHIAIERLSGKELEPLDELGEPSEAVSAKMEEYAIRTALEPIWKRIEKLESELDRLSAGEESRRRAGEGA